MKRVQGRYPLLHKRSAINRQSPFSPSFPVLISTFSTIFAFLDESEEEGAVEPLSKEEEEVEVMRSWVEVGGFPAQPEEEAKGLLSEASSCPLVPHSSFLTLPFQLMHELFLTVLAFYLDSYICLFFPGDKLATWG